MVILSMWFLISHEAEKTDVKLSKLAFLKIRPLGGPVTLAVCNAKHYQNLSKRTFQIEKLNSNNVCFEKNTTKRNTHSRVAMQGFQ